MKKNVAWGSVIILLAVYLIVSRLGIIPAFPFFKIVFTALFAYGVIHGAMKQNFFEAIMSLAILGCIYDEELGITAITPWILLLAGLLISIGLEMIFKNLKKKEIYEIPFNSRTEKITNFVDGDYVRCENNFGGTSKYVNSDHFTGADLENNFGSLNVYFENAIMANGMVNINAENNFGEMNLYFPRTWRVQCQQETAFGDIKLKGQGSMDSDAPSVNLHAEANFGCINIYFN